MIEEYQVYFDRYNDLKEDKGFYQRLKKLPKGVLQSAFEDAHEEIFEEIDCLKCGACCITISPVFTQKDVARLAKSFKQKPGQFVDDHLKLDEDEDLVLKSSPCTFLGDDNRCSVYDNLPKACEEYPHTNSRKMHAVMELTKENVKYCPAVAGIMTKMRELVVKPKLDSPGY